ncbi:MAG: FtsX-like permease family protein [Acidimicrobiales bacterium]
MDAVRVLLGADLRRRWRSWLALALLVGLAGGVAMASVAGWRRTLTAMERFVEHNRPTDVYVSGQLDRDELEAIPEVVATAGGGYMLMVPVGEDGTPDADQLGAINPFSVDDQRLGRTYERPIVVEGRLADPEEPLEVVVDEDLARTYGVEAGGRLEMAGYGIDQGEAVLQRLGTLAPTGPIFDFAVVGVVRFPADVVTKPSVDDVVYLGSRDLYLTPAFDLAHRRVDVLDIGALFGDPSAQDFEVRLRDGRRSEATLATAVRAMDPAAQIELESGDNLVAQRDAERAISVQATALLTFGVLVATAGLVLAGQAVRRQREDGAATRDTCVALGLTPRAVALVRLGGLVGAGSAAALVATSVAVALSPLAPVGFARRAEVDPGVHVDALVLGLGALAVLSSLVLHGLVGVVLPRRREVRRAAVAAGPGEWAARLRFPASAVAGVRAAWVQPGGRTVAITVLVAATGVVGGSAFAASQGKLVADPSLWGWTWDVVVGNPNDPTPVERELPALLDDERISDVAVLAGLGGGAHVVAADRSVITYPVTLDVRWGSVAPRLLEGALPLREDEVALGAATAGQLGVAVGDEVEISLQEGVGTFTVSGLAVFNQGLQAERIGEGALVAPSALERLGGEVEWNMVVVGFAPGADDEAVVAMLRDRFGNTVLRSVAPHDVDQLHRIRHLPTAFSLVVAAAAAATLAFVLGLTVRRSRRELALLRTLGFVRGQLRATVAAQATALVVPAAMLGAFLGAVVGRAVWGAVAREMGAPSVPVLPVSTALLFVVAAAVLGNAIALLPGRIAAATLPAAVLRAE